MFCTNIIVERPKNTVIYPNKYVYLTTKKIYLKDKKHNCNKRVQIGKMISDIKMNPNDAAREFFPEWFKDEEIPMLSDTISVGNTLLIDTIIKNTRINELLNSIFENDNLIKDLVNYMIINGTSTYQHFSSLQRRININCDKIYSDSKISEFLKRELKEEDIRTFMLAYNQIIDKDKKIYINYDSTNMNTTALNIELAEFGYSKDNDDEPVVNLSYATEKQTGKPLFYELYQGNVVDNTQMKLMIEKADDYGYKNIGFIIDKGYYSKTNIEYLEKHKYDYIMMIKNNKEKIEEYKYQFVDKVGHYIPNHEVYGMSIKCNLYTKTKNKYLHIYYNPEKALTEKHNMMTRFRKLEEELKVKVEKRLSRKQDVRRYENAFYLKFDNTGYLIKYSRKEKYMQEKVNELGYFTILTSEKMTAIEALEIYRERDAVEKTFKFIKTELEMDRLKVHDDASLRSKMFVTFIASVIMSEIYRKTKQLREKNRKIYTLPAIINELRRMEITKNTKGKYVRKYALTSTQKNILNQFGIDEDAYNNYIKKINSN